MALVINATAGSSTANSFVTAAEMTTYCDGRLNASVWTAAAAQLPALVEATRELTVLSWRGRTVTETQALAWPRQYAPNVDSATSQYYDSAIIPSRVKDAACEFALQFLKAGTTDIASVPSTDGITEKTVDVLTTKYADPRVQRQGVRRYPSVWRSIMALLTPMSGVSFAVIRG